MVGPIVTNPATRDWTVTASIFATLNEMYGNRTIVGIGRGDSAVRVTNGKPTTLDDAARVDPRHPRARQLAARSSTTARTLQFPWSAGSELEVWVAAYGPLALKLTGEVGDGFILQLADLDIAKWMIKTVRDAAGSAGRDPDVDHVLRRGADVHPTAPTRASRTRATRPAGSAAWSATTSPTSSRKYGDATAPCRRRSPTTSRAARATTTTRTARPATTTSTSCPTRSSTASACSAPPSEHIEKLEALKAIGVDQFAGYLQHDNKEETLRVYGETVIPALRDQMAAKA